MFVSTCPGCGFTTDPDWTFCPECGKALVLACDSCKGQLQPEWKVCPYCGGSSEKSNQAPTAFTVPPPLPPVSRVVELPEQSNTPVSLTREGETIRELSWVLHARMSEAMWEQFEPLLSRMQRSKTWMEYFTANDPAQYEIAFVRGLSAVLRLPLSDYPKHFQHALKKVESRQDTFQSTLVDRGKVLEERLVAIRQLGLPDNALPGYLAGSPNAVKKNSFGGWGMIGGATIGSVLFPGLGTVVGAIIGGFVGGSTGTNPQEVVQKFDAAREEMFAGVRSGYQQLWDRFVREVRELGEVPPLSSSEIGTAEAELNRIVTTTPLESGSSYRRIVRFIEEHGPKQEAVYLACRFCLDQRREFRTDALKWKDLQKQLYPDRVETIECEARYALEQKEYDGALSVLEEVDRGVADAEAIRVCRAEVFGAQGLESKARGEFPKVKDRGTRGPYWTALIRGLFRHGDEQKVWDACDSWLREADNPGVVARALRLDPLLSPHFEFFADHVSRLRPYRDGKRGLLRAVVEAEIRATKPQLSHVGSMPQEMRKNASESFLDLQSIETLLYFYDWSTWGNGKSGLALTDRRLIWKRVWQDPVQFTLRELDANQLRGIGSVFHIQGKALETGDALLAQTLPNALREVQKVIGG